MSCYHPNLIKVVVDPATGSLKYNFQGPARCEDPTKFGGRDDLATRGYYYMTVPCGKCVGCKLDYSRQWANRMILELKSNPKAVFVTLTYDNDHLPIVTKDIWPTDSEADVPLRRVDLPTLSKRDTQLFWKRLRKRFAGKRIRYFIAGEYGPRTHRPHYHAIIYGLGLDDFEDLTLVKYNNLGQPIYTTPDLVDTWQNGHISVAPCTWHTCAYTSRYCLKKAFGDNGKYGSHYGDVEPEFTLCSRRPGLGLSDYQAYIDSGNTTFAVDGRDGVYQVPLPRAMLRKALRDQYNLDVVEDLVYSRVQDQQDKLFGILSGTGKTYLQYLMDAERDAVAKTHALGDRKESL